MRDWRLCSSPASEVSNHLRFAEKLTDVIERFSIPPERAVVLWWDEKRQVQALNRTQSGLPLKRERAQFALCAMARRQSLWFRL